MSLILQLQYLAQPFVPRLMGKAHAAASGYVGLLSAYPLRPGQWADLGMVQLRRHHPARVRIVGVWGSHQKEAWWLAIVNHAREGRGAVLRPPHDRRGNVPRQQGRDSKGCRYGMELFRTRFSRPEQLDPAMAGFLPAAIAIRTPRAPSR